MGKFLPRQPLGLTDLIRYDGKDRGGLDVESELVAQSKPQKIGDCEPSRLLGINSSPKHNEDVIVWGCIATGKSPFPRNGASISDENTASTG